MHQHTIPQTLIYRKERVHHENIDKLSALKLFSLCKEELIPLIEHICETIYKTSRDDLLPCGDNGRCYLSRIVRLLTVFADIDDILVWLLVYFKNLFTNLIYRNTLLEAIEKRCNEVEKIQFWPSNCSISLEHMWLAPFILIFQV